MTLQNVFDLRNLRRAYRWILSNPDPRYKAYFRDSYAAFAIASDTALKRLRKNGLEGRYTPDHASKVMLPKASGTLRPLTLLTMDDQIVYQAIVNLTADLLKPKTKHRYKTRVYAHLYAGKTSSFFYSKWQDSYRQMANSIRHLHATGFVYVATFDLTAFYDSIDHHVLRHFLKELSVDEDVIDLLMTCLRQWTSSTWSTGPKTIYHEHGIPQGPLPSGMLSEVVLQHLDAAGERGRATRYIRYVDDIKILAKSEGELRRKLVALDLAAKEIGLFPQTSKINIRRMTDPNEEVKSVSRPPENSLSPIVNQAKLRARLLQITRSSRVESRVSTRFKFLLARAQPDYRLNDRLMNVFLNHPELSEAICLYFSKYRTIPKKLSARIIAFLKGPELYHSVRGDLLRASLGRMSVADTAAVTHFATSRLLRRERGTLRLQPTYKEALTAWVVLNKGLTFSELQSLRDAEQDWWIRKSILRELTPAQFGMPSYRDFINTSMRINESELSRCAAATLVAESISLDKPYRDVFEPAKITLRAAKIIRSVGRPPSLIEPILTYILNRPATGYDWPRFFGSQHRHAESMAIVLKQSREVDIDAFIIRFDSFADKITGELFRRYCPGKIYPNYGSALKHPALTTHLPVAIKAFDDLHALRLQSVTAHPRSLKTGAGTRRLRHYDFYKVRPHLIAAFNELCTTVIP